MRLRLQAVLAGSDAGQLPREQLQCRQARHAVQALLRVLREGEAREEAARPRAHRPGEAVPVRLCSLLFVSVMSTWVIKNHLASEREPLKAPGASSSPPSW